MTKQHDIKWRTIIGLLMLATALVMNWDWVWGLLFLFWVIPDLFTGTTSFIEEIKRAEHPILYWIIVMTWIGLSFYMLTAIFYEL